MIPPFQDTMLPILKMLSDGQITHKKILTDQIATKFNTTIEEKNQTTASSSQTVLTNRMSWSIHHLSKAGLLINNRGNTQITPDGQNVLKQNLPKINLQFLRTLKPYQEYEATFRSKQTNVEESGTSPQDMIDTGYNQLRDTIHTDLLEKVNSEHFSSFERLVVLLMEKMNYGIDYKVTGGPNDGGIDGVIRQDKLGIHEILIQAKRWKSHVPSKEIRDFYGAVSAKKSKGVFITSSDFTKEAYAFAQNTDLILINGEKLVKLMFEYNLGVSTESNYEIKKIDEAFFDDL